MYRKPHPPIKDYLKHAGHAHCTWPLRWVRIISDSLYKGYQRLNPWAVIKSQKGLIRLPCILHERFNPRTVVNMELWIYINRVLMKIPCSSTAKIKFSQKLTKFSQIFNLCSQILRNILKYLQNFRNVHVISPFSRKCNHFSAFSFCENQPEFLWNTLLFGENLILNFNTYPQQLWVRRIGKRTYFKIQSPWMYISAECLLKLIYNFYMCADDF